MQTLPIRPKAWYNKSLPNERRRQALQHRKRQITLKQRMGLCLAAFFAAFAMQLTLNGYQSRAV